jgi:redox-sensing transcriptional repressor
VETPILPVETMADYIRSRGIRIAIMTVPEQGALDVYETLLGCRIAGILNFAPVSLASTERCWVNNINLGLELEAVLYFVNNREDPGHE